MCHWIRAGPSSMTRMRKGQRQLNPYISALEMESLETLNGVHFVTALYLNALNSPQDKNDMGSIVDIYV